jgi:hypothetical protein
MVKAFAAVDWPNPAGVIDRGQHGDRARLNVLGAVAEALLHRDFEAVFVCGAYSAVEPVAASCGQFDSESTDVVSNVQILGQWVSIKRLGINDQPARVGRVGKSRPTGQNRRPRAARMIDRASDKERQLGVKRAVLFG